MANEEQLELLRNGAIGWNEWRKMNPDAVVDLGGAQLSGADLGGADLHDAQSSGADLSGTDLGGANLSRMYLKGADLSKANLQGASLREAYLSDRYGRTVARLYVGDLDVNQEMVQLGAAWVYRKYSNDQSLLDVEAEAKAAKRGLWALPEADQVPPWEWRRK